MTAHPTPREVLQRLLRGIGDDRWEHLHELYAPDTVVRHPLARDASRRLEGREALRAHFARFAALGRRLRARDVTWHETDDPEVVIAQFVYDGTGPDPDEHVEIAACFVWRVRDGLIVETDDYLDTPRPRSPRSAPGVNPDESTATRRARGERIVTELSGGARPASLDALERGFPFLSHAVHAYAVGELFARDVLDVRTRQLALVAAFAALGLGDFIKIHGGYAMNAGATVEELKEIVYLTTIPGGFPRAIQASQAVAELLDARSTS